jgi:oligopeptide/dipeptide ABC transporter ATP-binding protein
VTVMKLRTRLRAGERTDAVWAQRQRGVRPACGVKPGIVERVTALALATAMLRRSRDRSGAIATVSAIRFCSSARRWVGTGNCLRKYGARDRKRVILKGDVPSQINPPPGCHFHPRCPYALARCRHEAPALREIKPGHWASCHLHEDGVRVPLAKLGRE